MLGYDLSVHHFPSHIGFCWTEACYAGKEGIMMPFNRGKNCCVHHGVHLITCPIKSCRQGSSCNCCQHYINASQHYKVVLAVQFIISFGPCMVTLRSYGYASQNVSSREDCGFPLSKYQTECQSGVTVHWKIGWDGNGFLAWTVSILWL